MNTNRTTVAIIGGGASGALTAFHLARKHTGARIVIVEPRSATGLGLAYSTPSLRHLLNVPAGKISALPDQPSHFLNWLRRNFDANATADTFAPRAVFGNYLRDIVSDSPGVEHLHYQALALHRTVDGFRIRLENGSDLRADAVVLALGNFDPARLRGVPADTEHNGVYHANAWAPAAYEHLPAGVPVTLIGSGLTAVDVLLRLRENGHRGVITSLSRHGIFPQRHEPYVPSLHPVIPLGTPATCVSYLRVLRKAIRGGVQWRAAIDSLRPVTNALWLALPPHEQQRFRRHLQRRWEVVRHRMAPPIADTIEAELRAGTLRILRGNFAGMEVFSGGAVVTMEAHGHRESFRTGRVINCTGPSQNYRRVGSPLLTQMLDDGLLAPGALGFGLAVTPEGLLIDANGNAQDDLMTLGPLRLGTLLESIAIPEIREQSVEVAEHLALHIGRQNMLLAQVS